MNIQQSPEELNDLYGDRDYYWYLRHPAWIEYVIKPMADCINALNVDWCIDAGCGEALLGDYFCRYIQRDPFGTDSGYRGFDLSHNAIERATKRNSELGVHNVLFGAPLDDPPRLSWCSPSVVVFSGILEVLIKQERRLEFLEFYRGVYGCRYFLIQDLLRLDDIPIQRRYDLVDFWYVSIPPEAFDGKLEEVKLKRKVMLFKCQ